MYVILITADLENMCTLGTIYSTISYECVPKNNFLIPQPKLRLWVLKRNVSVRRFFCAPNIYVKMVGKKKITVVR